jgi:hypothetical protein
VRDQPYFAVLCTMRPSCRVNTVYAGFDWDSPSGNRPVQIFPKEEFEKRPILALEAGLI